MTDQPTSNETDSRDSSSARNLFWGLLLITAGILLGLPALGLDLSINWDTIWPLFYLIPGLYFWASYHTHRQEKRAIWNVFPATILTGVGGLALVGELIDWELLQKVLFTLTLSMAASFWLAWWLGSRHLAYLIGAIIMTAIAGLILIMQVLAEIIIPALLILIGVYILFGRSSYRFGGKSKNNQNGNNDQTIDSTAEPADSTEKLVQELTASSSMRRSQDETTDETDYR